MKTKTRLVLAALALLALSTFNSQLSTASAQGTAFAYQGRLNDGANPANGSYDLRFAIYDSVSAGTLVAGPITNSATSVTNGLFTTVLDFGGVFDGSTLWLDIAARTNGANIFATLTPRQPITAAPYAITAGNLANPLQSGIATTNFVAHTLTNLGGPFITNITVSLITNLARPLITNVVISLLPTNCCCDNESNVDWHVTGNVGTTAGINFLGTIDNQPLELKAFNQRALRLEPNAAAGAPNVIGGSFLNKADPGIIGATISGGGVSNYSGFLPNQVSANFGTIGGGVQNNIGPGSDFSTVSGGQANTIQSNAPSATIGGGGYNNVIQVGAYETVIGGGSQNTIQAGAYESTISGGFVNTIGIGAFGDTIGGGRGSTIGNGGDDSTIAGGEHNTIGDDNDDSTIGGGDGNFIGNNTVHATIGGGAGNTITASANQATIPGGYGNVAGGQYSFAAGLFANATNDGVFVWADSNYVPFYAITNNEFAARATGGVRFVSAIDTLGNPTAGVQLMPGSGSWTSLSDRNAKANFEPVEPLVVLEHLIALPVGTWNYKAQPYTIRHIGPTAQDFKAAFGVGETDVGISTVDEGGVALAAIQGLNEKLEAGDQKSESRLQKLENENAELKLKNDSLEKRLAALEQIISKQKSN